MSDRSKDYATTDRPPSLFARLSPRSAREALQPVAAPPPPPVQLKRRRRGGLISWVSNILTLGLIAVVIGGGATFFVRQQIGSAGPLAEPKTVIVRGGLWDIAEQLEAEGVIANRYVFIFNAMTSGKTTQLKAGEYQFPRQVTIGDAVDILVRGRQVLHSITIPEGLTSEQVLARLREHDLLKGDVRDVPAEGSLLPNTYKFFRDSSRAVVIREMQQEHRKVVDELWRKRSPDLPIRNVNEFVALASIVEKETGRADERPRVAAVFVNRLNRKMKLQSDPTIVYGIVQGKGTLGRPILKSDIERRTAYNTYVIEGLPPGPIANPGRAALEAVANPPKTNELFFVADGTGGHAFAATLDEHNRNVAKWRAIEKSRGDAAAKPVDRVAPPDEAAPPEPPAPGAQRPANVRRRSAVQPPAEAPAPLGAPADLTPAGDAVADLPQKRGNAGRVLVEAVEGKPKDPLKQRGFDLTSPQTVPKLR